MLFRKHDEAESGIMQTTEHQGRGKRKTWRESLARLGKAHWACCLFGSFLDNSSRRESRKSYESFLEHQMQYLQNLVLDHNKNVYRR